MFNLFATKVYGHVWVKLRKLNWVLRNDETGWAQVVWCCGLADDDFLELWLVWEIQIGMTETCHSASCLFKTLTVAAITCWQQILGTHSAFPRREGATNRFSCGTTSTSE